MDGTDVADLYAYVSGGALALEEMLGRIKSCERGALVSLRIEAYVDLGDFREGVDTGLDSGNLAFEREIGIGRARG